MFPLSFFFLSPFTFFLPSFLSISLLPFLFPYFSHFQKGKCASIAIGRYASPCVSIPCCVVPRAVCPSVCPSVDCPSVCPSVDRPPVCLFVCPSVCLWSVRPSDRLWPVCPSVRLWAARRPSVLRESVDLSVYLSICLSIYMSVCQSFGLFLPL